MARCEVCGNEYDKSFEVVAAGQRHVFDSFECAIHRMAPVCEHCSCKVIGHGVEADGRFFCCHHCAEAATAEADPVDEAAAEIDARSPEAPEQIEELKEEADALGRDVTA